MKKTLKRTMIFWIWGITFILFSCVLIINMMYTRKQIQDNLKENAMELASYHAKKIDEQFSKASVVPVMNAINLQRFLKKGNATKEDIENYLKDVLEANPYIYGTCIAFEPNEFTPGEKYFAPYYHWSDPKGGKAKLDILGNDDYNYFIQDWYSIPRNSEYPVWIEPYLDTGVNVFMVTYATHFFRRDIINGIPTKTISGVTTADIALRQLTDEINSIGLLTSGYAYIISNKGVFIAFPNIWHQVSYKTIYYLRKKINDNRKIKILELMAKNNKKYLLGDLIEELKNLSFTDEEITEITNKTNFPVLNNITNIDPNQELRNNMLEQMTIAKDKANVVNDNNIEENFTWFTITEETIKELKYIISNEKLEALKTIKGKHPKVDLKTILKESTEEFSADEIEIILDKAEKDEMPWFLINKKIIDNIATKLATNKLSLESIKRFILNLNNNFNPELIKTIIDRKLPGSDFYSELKKLGFYREEIIEIEKEIEKEIILYFTIKENSLEDLKKHLSSDKIEDLEALMNKTFSTGDFATELKKSGFQENEIIEILYHSKKQDFFWFFINDNTIKVLRDKLKAKFDSENKYIEGLLNKTFPKIEMVNKLTELRFNDQEITEILGQFPQKTDEEVFEINDFTINILKKALEEKYEFNLNYISTMVHRSFSEDELIKELKKLNLDNYTIDIIKDEIPELYKFSSNTISDPYHKEKSLIYIYPIRNGDFCIGFVYPEDEVYKELYTSQQRSALISTMGLILLLLVIIILSNSITSPLSRLVEAVKRIAQGDLEHKILLPKSTYEVDTLTSSINTMMDDLKNYIEENQKITSEKERMLNELSVANKIQMSVIPQKFPAFPDRKEIDIYANINPALEVGGDLYDFAFIDEDHLGFVIGDASGKGIPAALFVAVTRAFLRATTLSGRDTASRYEPGECFKYVNNLLCSEDYMNMFMTMFYGALNVRTGELHYCNAGHNPPYLFKKDGTVIPLKTINGPALGAFDDVDYSTVIMDIEGGIFLYTDGVTEAFNKNEEEFSDERLYNILKGVEKFVPEEVVKKVTGEVARFSEGAPQSDDITVMAIKYMGNQ